MSIRTGEAGLDVPVVLVVFNRAAPLRQVFEQVRAARPRTLLVVADGPRSTHPDDAARCAETRAVIDVDWPCEVRRNEADHNLGCDARLTSGLDWAFSEVDRAIVLEDDVVPHPAFFGWAAAQLARYADDDEVMHVAGRNELGRWGSDDADHLVIRRGSIWGWATWRRAWTRVDRSLSSVDDPTTAARLAGLAGDPLVANHLAVHLDNARAGALHAWDVTWSLARILAGGLSVAPRTNLIRNVGFGSDATRTTDPDDLRGGLPVIDPDPTAGPIAGERRPPVDPVYDRWALLVDLMSTYRDPDAARRVARSRELLARAGRPLDRAARHHLAPFDEPEESVAALRHVRAAGSSSPALDRVLAVLERAAERNR